MTVLIGMNFYAAQGDAGRRQDRAIAALRDLRDAQCVNVQWVNESFEVPGIATINGLTRDSGTVTGRKGPKKPIVSDILQVLAVAAEERGCRYFLYANSDIEIGAPIPAYIADTGSDGYAFARTDIDFHTGAHIGPMLFGVDAFAFDVRWWQRHRTRFRAYIGGEPVWDNVYTAILLSRSNGQFVSRDGFVRHIQHAAAAWQQSPYKAYTTLLAALDRPYFTLWAEFHAELTALGSSPGNEEALRGVRERLFTAEAARRGWLVQQLRGAKAHIRYALRGRRA